jgi:hypothetical protein
MPTGNAIYDNLLQLLQDHPEIVKEIVLDPVNLKYVLKKFGVRNRAAADFLKYVASPKDGYNIVQFLHNTTYLGICAKGTFVLSCLRGTSPTGWPSLVPGPRGP